MIKIDIHQQYKSIKKCEFELEDFGVISEKNGSGKSHILEVIEEQKIKQTTNPDKTIFISSVTKYETGVGDIVRIGFGELNPKVTENFNPEEINNFIKDSINYTND